MNYVITLVHGTWARDAPWTQESSLLCQTLCKLLPEPVKLERFLWSGQNSHRARREAGYRLEHHLRRLVAKYPSAEHYVVCHSHGGNVALYALRDEGLQKRLAGVVCLSTPFLNFSERPMGRAVHIYLMHAFFLLILPLAIYLYANGPTDTSPWGVPPLPPSPTIWQWWNHWANVGFQIWFSVIVLGSLIFGVIDASGSVSRWNPLFAIQRAKEMLKDLTLPAVTKTSLLIIRVEGDEASSVLIAAQFTGWIFSEFWKLIDRTMRRLIPGRVKTTAILALFFAFIGVILVSMILSLLPTPIHDIVQPKLRLAYDVVVGVTMLLVLLLSVVSGLLLLLAAILSVVLIPFGGLHPVDGLFVETTVEASPSGGWQVHQLRKRGQDAETEDRFSLTHSEAYDNTEALELMGRWMRNGRHRRVSRGDPPQSGDIFGE